MTALAGAKRSAEYHAALLETQSLRMESQAIRAEVQRHEAEHFPTTQDEENSK
jgi:hypothetical protein